MRTLMRETLLLMLAAGGNNDLAPNSLVSGESRGLSYADFTALRPDYAASSWRGTLNRLVEQHYALKNLTGKRVTFELTRLGEQWLTQNVFSGFLSAQEERMSLVLLRPSSGRKQAYGKARRLLEERGYQGVIPGVYVTQTGGYSDLLWQNLNSAGFVSVFLRIPVSAASPIRISEFIASISDPTSPQREWKRLSNELDELLTIAMSAKALKAGHKKRIGAVTVSGLELTSGWTPLLADTGLTQPEVQSLLNRIFELMQKFLSITQR